MKLRIKQLTVIMLAITMSVASYADNPTELNPELLPHLERPNPQTLHNANGVPLPKIHMLHVNGINTTKKEADTNKEALEKNSQLVSSDGYLVWDVVYNPTADADIQDSTVKSMVNVVDNILDVERQKILDPVTDILVNNVTIEHYINFYAAIHNIKIDNEQERNKLRTMLLPHYKSLLDFMVGANADDVINHFHDRVPEQLKSVLMMLSHGESPKTFDYSKTPDAVLLLPHSQGNLYANRLYEYLTEYEHFNKDHIAIYGMATPAEDQQGDWPIHQHNNMSTMLDAVPKPITSYTTSSSDIVINGLAQQNLVAKLLSTEFPIFRYVPPISPVLPANIAAGLGDDTMGHNLIKTYLTVPALKNQIVKMINYYAYMLNYNQMHDIVSSMTITSPLYGLYPKVASFIIGYTRLDADQIIAPYYDSYGPIVDWDKDYDYKYNILGFVFLSTPVLDSYVNTGGSSKALMHFLLYPNFTDGKRYNRIVYEKVKGSSNNLGYPVRVYPYADTDQGHYNDNYLVALYKPRDYVLNSKTYCALDPYYTPKVLDPFGKIDIGIETLVNKNEISKINDCYDRTNPENYNFFKRWYDVGYYIDAIIWR